MIRQKQILQRLVDCKYVCMQVHSIGDVSPWLQVGDLTYLFFIFHFHIMICVVCVSREKITYSHAQSYRYHYHLKNTKQVCVCVFVLCVCVRVRSGFHGCFNFQFCFSIFCVSVLFSIFGFVFIGLLIYNIIRCVIRDSYIFIDSFSTRSPQEAALQSSHSHPHQRLQAPAPAPPLRKAPRI